MNKQQAIKLFGGIKPLYQALQCTPHAIYGWHDTDDLPRIVIDRVIGAYVRTRGKIPDKNQIDDYEKPLYHTFSFVVQGEKVLSINVQAHKERPVTQQAANDIANS